LGRRGAEHIIGPTAVGDRDGEEVELAVYQGRPSEILNFSKKKVL
jgi:hypothetical protein